MFAIWFVLGVLVGAYGLKLYQVIHKADAIRFCEIHTKIRLNSDNSCDYCLAVAQLAAKDEERRKRA